MYQPTATFDNSLTADQLAPASVGSSELQSSAVQTSHIAEGNVTESRIGNGAITWDKMADDSVGTAEILDDSIIASKVAVNSINQSHLLDDVISANELQDDAVTRDKILDAAISAEKLADNCVTSAALAHTLSVETQLSVPYIINTSTFVEIIPPTRWISNDDADHHAFIIRGNSSTVSNGGKFGVAVSDSSQELYHQFTPPYRYRVQKCFVRVQARSNGNARTNAVTLRQNGIAAASFSNLETFDTNVVHTCTNTNIKTSTLTETEVYYTLDVAMDDDEVLTGAYIQYISIGLP